LQMLFEVFLRIAQVALGLGGQHLHFLAHTHRPSCNEIITTRRPKIGLDASMKAMLNSHFLRHALPLTFVRAFASDNYPKTGRDWPIIVVNQDDFCPIIIRSLSEVL
jgi:hypothetical protein